MRWTDEQETAYLHCLKEGTKRGMRTDAGFKPSFIPFVNAQFAAKGLPAVRREQLNSKRADWKAKFTAWHWLLLQPGVEYDQDSGRIRASEEQWEQFARQNPFVRPFRFVTLRYKDDLHEIFGGRALTGRYVPGGTWYEEHESTTLEGIQSFASHHGPQQTLPGLAVGPTGSTQSTTAHAPTFPSRPLPQHAPPATPTSTSIEACPEGTGTGLENLSECIKTIAQQQRHQGRQAQDLTENPIARAIKTLQSMYTDLSPDDFVRAVTVVEDHVHTFNALSGKWRDIWLRAKIAE